MEESETYTVYVAALNKPVTLPRPLNLPKPGTLLRVRKPFSTLACFNYGRGDALRLIARTYKAPYGYLSSLGNWIVECDHQVSVWSNIEAMMAEGALE